MGSLFYSLFMINQPISILLVIFSIQTCSLQKFNNTTTDLNTANSNDNMTKFDQSYELKILNGRVAKLGEVPYQISFKRMISRSRKMFKNFCGGVLIAPNKLLSAAHCFEESGSKCFKTGRVSRKKLSRTFAVAGNLHNVAPFASDSLNQGQWRAIRSMVYPRKFHFPRFDISVGFTKEPFTINANVAVLPYTTQHREYKGECLASGFGRMGPTQTAHVLYVAHLKIMSTYTCSRKHRRSMTKFVCTISFPTDVGKGDSGGPLVCANTGDPKESKDKGILVGIVSGNALRIGSFFTRVSAYSTFIDRGMGTSNEPDKALFWLCLIYKTIVFYLHFVLF